MTTQCSKPRSVLGSLVIYVTVAAPLGGACSDEQRAPMSVDAINVCSSLEAAARCDTKNCIEVVCWQKIGATATTCPRVIQADFDAFAQVMESHHGTYPIPNQCNDDEFAVWGLRTSVQDSEIWGNGCSSWVSDNEFRYHFGLLATDPDCIERSPSIPRID